MLLIASPSGRLEGLIHKKMSNSTSPNPPSGGKGVFEINKGIGRTVEFKGLKSQYLFIFAGGLLAVFILVVILYMFGVSQVLCLVLGVSGATVLVWQTFAMNRRYGEHGLMKRRAVSRHPRYLICRRSAYRLLQTPPKKKGNTR